jgi:hypothetical protein
MPSVRILRVMGPRKVVAFGLVALCVLLASGRMNTVDGSSQLAQAVHFCVTGHVAANHAIDGEFSRQDFSSSSTTFYDSTDIGGTLLMFPAATTARASTSRTRSATTKTPACATCPSATSNTTACGWNSSASRTT